MTLSRLKPMRLWHTLRWLRPVQFYGRLWFRLYRPRPDLQPAPPRRTPMHGQWIACARAPSMLGSDRFRFLSVERQLADPGDWNRADWPKLWLYNAHYFDDLTADDAGQRSGWHRMLLTRWVAENPPGRGNGWEPYPTSLRIVNWCKWGLAGNALPEGAGYSLAVQARWLRGRLEHHLLGNHLWANAKALVFAGALFDGEEATRWRDAGLRLLRRELREQVLPDGGHFERSPMYHAILTEDVLDLLQLAQRFPALFAQADVQAWREAALRMLRWLRVMTHPDGGIALFNDAALGIAPTLAVLHAYAGQLGVVADAAPLAVLESLQPSGYVRMAAGDALLLADVAPIGPDYLPGHAHADTLSFELSLRDQRILVNGGTSTYQNDAERLRQRGTAAHNTVVVDGQDSSDVWSAFRVARRARVHDLDYASEGETLRLSAWHDGYHRLPGKVTHRRAWQLRADGLRVTDMLDGGFESAEARYLFAPGATLRWQIQGGEGRLEAANWHPRFGESISTQVLVVCFTETSCSVQFSWD